MRKKLLVLFLVFALVLTACGGEKDNDNNQSETLSDAQHLESTMGQDENVEVNVQTEHMDAYEASTTGKWEAMFTPINLPERKVDLEGVDISPTDEELEAMKKEPAYGEPIQFYMSDGCTSGPTVANHLGYYEEAGLKAEGVKGMSAVEALGTGQVTVAVNHIAMMLVPVTNGVDINFVGGAHIGCKSLYTLTDSDYKSTADLKGTYIAVPSGVGGADYNITCMMLDADRMNPQNDVELIPVAADACISAMERGEISSAILSDAFAYGLVKDGKLKCIRSLLDEDFQDMNCCVIAMNGTFVKENPVISKKIVQAVQKAHSYMRNNPDEATKMLIDQGWNSGSYEMNVMLNNSLQFGVSDEMTEKGLRKIAESYIKLGIINSTDNVDEVMDMVWHPVLSE